MSGNNWGLLRMSYNLTNQPFNALKTMTCKRCGDSEDRVQGYCSNQCKDLVEVEELREDVKAMQEENALLTIKLKGLEDIDDDRGSLIKIIEGAIEDFEGIGYQYEADDLRKKLKKAIK